MSAPIVLTANARCRAAQTASTGISEGFQGSDVQAGQILNEPRPADRQEIRECHPSPLQVIGKEPSCMGKQLSVGTTP